jgi:hypothetical protein
MQSITARMMIATMGIMTTLELLKIEMICAHI